MTPVEDIPFDAPFSAGSFATIHPSSLVVDFEIKESVLKEYNVHYEAWDHASDQRLAKGQKETFEELPEKTIEFLSRHAHELDHVNRFLGTSFGFLCDTIRNQWLIRAAQLINERSIIKNRQMFPLELIRTATSDSFDYVKSLLNEPGNNENKTTQLFTGLTRLLTALVDDVTPSQFCLALFAMCNGNTDDIDRLTGQIKLTHPKCAAFQTTDKREVPFSFTTRHIIELFAIREQGNSLLSMDASLRTLNHLLNETKDEYIMAHLAWNEFFPSNAINPSDAELELDWIKSFPLELFVVADLALWPPFMPDSGIPIDVIRWTDLHPAHRFVNAIRSMKRLGVMPGTTSKDDQNKRFVEIQEAVCRDRGWLTPQKIAKRWLEHLNSMPNSFWPILDGASTFRMENAKRLLVERLKQPAAVALNNVDMQSLGVEGACAWIISHDHGRKIRPMGKTEYRALVPFWMMESVQQLLIPDRPLFGNLFEPLFRQTAFDLTVVLLGSAGRWSQYTIDRFRDESKGLFNIRD